MSGRATNGTSGRSASLVLRTIGGFMALAVVVGVALFGPAGTIAYWQAWLYPLVFFGYTGVITIYLWRADPMLLQRRVEGGPLAEQEASQRVIQSLASVAFLAVFVISGLDRRFGWSSVPAPLSIGADVLVAAGFGIIFLVFSVNTYTAATIRVADEQTVVSSGPYSVVRHPMYAGALLMLLATPIALGSWWCLLACAPLIGVIVWRLLDEEHYLVERLPDYAEYRARVRTRLIPGVW
jgi:protein-S-isoprenylcysteine O-methyltransferase Ste14